MVSGYVYFYKSFIKVNKTHPYYNLYLKVDYFLTLQNKIIFNIIAFNYPTKTKIFSNSISSAFELVISVLSR